MAVWLNAPPPPPPPQCFDHCAQTLRRRKLKLGDFYGALSQSIPSGYIPPGNPRGLAQNTCPGVEIWLLKVARGPGIRQGPGFCEKWKWNKLNFWPFSRFTCFLNGIFPGLWVNFLVLLSHTHKIWGVAPGLFVFEVFTGLWLSTPTFVQKVMIMLNVLSVYWFY